MKECQTITAVSRVKIEERGKKATFVNDDEREFILTRMDGCVVKNDCAADWVVSVDGVGCIIVELKGGNVDRAVKQVEVSTEYWMRNRNNKNCRVGGLIVSRNYPRCSTSVQRAQNRYARKYNSPLHVKTHAADLVFESVLGFV